MYSLTLPFSYFRESDVCKLIVHWCGEGMATEVTKYNDPALWKFFVSLCSASPLQRPVSVSLMGVRTAVIHWDLFGIREGFCRREDHKQDVNKRSSTSL